VGEANHDHMYFVPLTDPMQASTSAASSTTLNSRDTPEEIAENGATAESHEANLETPDKTATNNPNADPGGDLAESTSAPDREPASDHAHHRPPINRSDAAPLKSRAHRTRRGLHRPCRSGPHLPRQLARDLRDPLRRATSLQRPLTAPQDLLRAVGPATLHRLRQAGLIPLRRQRPTGPPRIFCGRFYFTDNHSSDL
jgi:hypothetical protein